MAEDEKLPMGVLLARAGYALFELKHPDREHVISLLERAANNLRISCSNKNKVKD